MYRLIIIDDEEKIVEGMGLLFPWETIGFSVEGLFTSAVKALEFMEDNPVDVVLSDIEMPDMDGIELSKRLLEKEGVKVVLFSSHRDYDYFRAAIQNRVEDFLLKPVDYAMLLECLGNVKEKLDANSQKKVELPKGYYDRIVSGIREYLMKNYQNASLEGAAEKVNLSPAYVSRIFKEKSGMSFSDTLLSIRMEKAKEMLADIRYKSYDIAYYIGYDNPKNFSRAFKAYCGMTPMEYRKAKTEAEQ